jgi:glycogen operon protein
LLCARRVQRGAEHERSRLTLAQIILRAKKSWHGVKLDQPDWGDGSRSIAFTAELREEKMLVHLILNAYWEPLEFELPQAWGMETATKTNTKALAWQRWIDTAQASPQDIVPWQSAPKIPSTPYRAESRSVVVLYAGL